MNCLTFSFVMHHWHSLPSWSHEVHCLMRQRCCFDQDVGADFVVLGEYPLPPVVDETYVNAVDVLDDDQGCGDGAEGPKSCQFHTNCPRMTE